MTKNDKLDPNSEDYTNALLEDMNGKFEAILEATAPIPKIQEKVERIDEIQEKVERIERWEKNVNLIPAIFEEVGSLRKDVEILKEAHKLLDRHSQQLEDIEKRLKAVEHQVHS